MGQIQRLGNVIYRTANMDAGVAFYRDVLGLTLKFRDGDRWAAFDAGGVVLALEGAEAVPQGEGGATVSLRATGLDPLVRQLRERGALVGEIAVGAHERTVAISDPDGNRLLIYEPFPSS